MKKIIALLLTLAMVFALAACGKPEAPAENEAGTPAEAPAEAPAEEILVATIMQTNNDWAAVLAKGGEETAAKYGWKHITMNPEGDIQKQIDCVESCISQGVDAMFVHTVDSVAIADTLKKALDAGIYVFVQNDMVDTLSGYENAYFAAYNHVAAAEEAAKKLIDAIEGAGKVGIIAGIAGADNTMQRTNGFTDYVTANYPEIEIVNTINCDWDRALAMSAAEDMITANPDLKGIFVMGEDMAWGVVDAVENSGKDIQIVAMDASSTTVQMIMDGRIYATVGCPPKSFSGTGFDVYKQILDGVTFDSHEYDVSFPVVDAENASFDLADYIASK